MKHLPSSYRQEKNCVFVFFTNTTTTFAFICHEIQEGLSKEALTLHGTLKRTLIFSAVYRVEFEPNNPNN